MDIRILKPRQALNKAYLKVKPNRSDIDRFKTYLIYLLDHINEKESEEHHKNLVSEFLKKTYYDPHHFINTKERNDMVIHNGHKDSTVGVIIEAKKPGAKSEMVTTQKLNTKAFHELILYYLRERITHKNLEVRHLIITNINEWFIFDATQFDKLFADDKKLVEKFNDFEGKRLSGVTTDFFYKQIAEPFVNDLKTEITFTHFDLQAYQKPLRNADKADDNQLIALYKLLSPEHLLKLPFANDSNSLDKQFYTELLHIIGLKEVSDGGKKLITRNEIGELNSGTIIEDAIVKLDAMDKINRLDQPSQYGATYQERLFNVGLELTITWINRILFLKLLEAQLISYHKGDISYRFLNSERIKSYDHLYNLFFEILAKQSSERKNLELQRDFEKVPYLNSSLFELSDLEQVTFTISSLNDDSKIPILNKTVLKNSLGKKQTGELNTLTYLFSFLDAYDFSGEGSEEIQEDNKTLINASVLGLIFEKINGYKDGSFFTPGFITMYMCKETIRRAVVQKFNDVKGWHCETIDDLYENIDAKDRNEANAIVNSIKICDPAVGSGHFLVSALNEMIAIKHDLRILHDREGKRLKEYQVEVVNDELIITDDEGEFYEYHPKNKESQRLQETLFHEKETIIENCLFGVDINTNSVKICRLRLWIELLKHAYYKSTTELETLPNIDINIKCGNSLVSRFAIDADMKQALKKSKWKIDDYKIAVATYRNASDKEEKRAMLKLIADIKSDFRSEINKNDPKLRKLQKLQDELFAVANPGGLFELTATEKKTREQKMQKLAKEIVALENDIEEIVANKIYENAFEWRFEFPEVLDDEGVFVGFDVVLANPPYIRQEELMDIKPYLKGKYQVFAGTADLYVYFVELAMNLLRQDGEFIFILPNKWMRAGYGKSLRNFIKEHAIRQIVDFGDLPVFEEATTYPCILQLSKSAPTDTFHAVNITSLDFTDGLENFVKANEQVITMGDLSEEGWTLTHSKIQKLLSKIKSKGIPLCEYVEGKIYRGVLTGLNEAFVIDRPTRDRLIAEDPKSQEIIKPFLAGRDIKRYKQPTSEKFLIFTRRGIVIKNYPAVLTHLTRFKSQLEPRPKDFKGDNWPGRKPGTYKWYEIQDAVDYYPEFESLKLIYPNICQQPEFTFDPNGTYTNQKCFIITKWDLNLLGILNSNLTYFLFQQILPKLRGGFYEPSYKYFKDFPIEQSLDDKIKLLVSKIITLKNENTTSDTANLESQIDQLVYELYGLTEEEIGIVERTNGI